MFVISCNLVFLINASIDGIGLEFRVEIDPSFIRLSDCESDNRRKVKTK